MLKGPQKTKLRLELEALKIGESKTFTDEHEMRKAQFISWELRKKLGYKFQRKGLTITRLDNQEIVESANCYFIALYGIIGTCFEGPFASKNEAVEWLNDYVPNEPGRNGEPEFGMVIGPIPTKMFREF